MSLFHRARRQRRMNDQNIRREGRQVTGTRSRISDRRRASRTVRVDGHVIGRKQQRITVGAALAASSVPMLPAPPDDCPTTICCPHRCPSSWPTARGDDVGTRARGKGMTKRTGFAGIIARGACNGQHCKQSHARRIKHVSRISLDIALVRVIVRERQDAGPDFAYPMPWQRCATRHGSDGDRFFRGGEL